VKQVTAELAAEHGLSAAEYRRLIEALGRTPSYTELGIVSVMWSEHCSYKSSRAHLKTLPTEGPRVIQGPGENAGVVDIGDNQAVVFKMESHNHPSFIEPYQGAATGVGGICRDVFTMGARPIAIADCLRFGAPDHPRTAYLVSGVVAGIGGYGNSFGVPTVAGDVSFHPSYDGNILVNAFCLGLAPADRIWLGTASGVGNPILYVGAKTGRDGIHGATMASAEFDQESEAKRPAVQVGDPFMEKLLLEACLELMATDVLVGIQDMGAAGLTSSSVEMAARAGSGVELDLDAVPTRETGMTPYELMLSESQERMLMVVKAGREAEAMAIFAKWDLDAAVVGRVTDSGRVVARMGGEVHADLPADLLAEGLVYERPFSPPGDLESRRVLDLGVLGRLDAAAAILDLVGDPGIASKAWVYRQYDYNVRHGTVVRPGEAGAGVVRVRVPGGRDKGLAIAAGCAERYVALDPRRGTRLVVAEAYANLVALGATPLAVTNCLNFGNPEKPEIMWQLAESIRGLGEACRELETPVVSGNVSLYNETDGRAIRPTPMIAMVGLIDPLERHPPGARFRREGDRVAVVGAIEGSLAGSSYLDRRGQLAGELPALDVGAVRPVLEAARRIAAAGLAASLSDISDGGLAVALAEAVAGGVGASLRLPPPAGRLEALLFGEGPARFVASYSDGDAEAIGAICSSLGATLIEIGRTSGRSLSIEVTGRPEILVELSVEEIAERFATGFAAAVGLSG
jgi:phosphoribosylformylglycinamidine synthase